MFITYAMLSMAWVATPLRRKAGCTGETRLAMFPDNRLTIPLRPIPRYDPANGLKPKGPGNGERA
jgi:hypothetical protein